jgi:hypothetical protein
MEGMIVRHFRKTALVAVPTVAALTASGLLLALGAGVASAATNGINPVARTEAETAISVRITALHSAGTLVRQTGWFAGSDQAALENIISGDLNGNGQAEGLTALATTIRNETNPVKFRAEVQTITTDYRVFALVLPQVHLVRAGDRLTTDTVPTLHGLDVDLKKAIAQEAAEGKNVQAAEAAVKDMEAQIDIIGQKTSGTSAALLALTPSEWNANHGIVAPYRDDIAAAGLAAHQAGKDAQAALQDLQ